MTDTAPHAVRQVTGTLEFPVSWAQQRLWFLDQLEDLGSAYTVRLPVRLRGRLDEPALQRALDALVARHEALRTTIRMREGQPVQVVAATLRVPLERVELPAGAGDAGLRAAVTALSRHAFDLARGPLLRVHLVRAAPEDHVLLVLMHHAISDAWSSGVFFRDLAALYAADVAGREPALAELPVQYADFAAWQREWLQGAELERQLAFWREALAGAPPLLALPTDRPRPAAQSYRGNRWTRALPRELTARVRAVATAEGCTPFMVLLAAFCALLARWSGQDDVVVGTPVAGRRRTELEGVIGFFANTLAMRADLAGDPTFRELLARVKRGALAAWAHQDLPFEKLVEALRPERSLAHSPVFQVMFILQNAPWEAAPLPGLDVRPAEMDAPDGAKFDLTLSATEYAGETWLGFEYSRDLFDAATVERLAGQYEALLAAALAAPGEHVGDLAAGDPSSPAARLDGAAVAMDPLTTVHGLVEAAARRAPDAVAVEMGTQRWSYRALDERADTLADRLRALGLGPGRHVGICLERSPEMLAAVLGVLKAGAAWVPLDPSFPVERLRFMLDDSGAEAVITSRALAVTLAAFEGRVLVLDDLAPAACAARGPPPPAIGAADDAYLIYTSGSTGVPKGVRVTHGAVANFLSSMLREPGIAAGDRWLAVTTLAFDIAVLELFGPLCAGATVVLAGADEARDGRRLARLLGERRIGVMQATPATWRALVAAGWAGRPGLRILCGGEALDGALAAQLLARGAGLWNLYGPTETTIWSSCARVTDAARVHVGGPIANTSLRVLDARLRPVPVGVAGELVIGGSGVSPGYWRRAALTAERFVALPDGERVYRTGDRARLRADGVVELLGRLDDQVKLRGFRVELGEVESALAAEPGVAACAAAVREVTAGDVRLAAWVVAREGAVLDAATLRERLRARLPEYMVPAAIAVVERLPLTPNGKVDRKALPAPRWGEGSGAGYAAPRDAVEAELCALFGEVLGTTQVGIHDDFFALGGHSLLATRLVSRVRDALGVELPLKALFEAPTVAGLAGRLATAGMRGVAVTPRLNPGATAPLSWPQQRLWFLEQLAPGNAAYHLHVAYRLRGVLDVAALQAALDAVVARHGALRTTFRAKDGEAEQVITPALVVPIERVRLDGASSAGIAATEDPRAELVATDAAVEGDDARLQAELQQRIEAPFDLARGPLLRAALLETGPDEQVLLLVVHHIVADGWSLAVLLGELSTGYGQRRCNEPIELPVLPVQYADYAEWQRGALDGAELEKQLDYWRAALAGAPARLELPADRPRLPVQRHRGARLTQDVPGDVVAGLHRLARGEGATFFMVAVAAFEALLARWTGQEDFVLGTPVAGRGRTELEGLVGFFVNTLALRADLRGDPPFRELVARAKRAALDAFAHADVPFEKLVDELRPPRDPARTPVFQVMFNLHNEPAQALAFPGLEAQRLAVGRRTSKFDLTVGVVEHAGGLSATFEYDADLFDRETIDDLAGGYAALLAAVAADAGARLGALPALGGRALARAAAESARVRSCARQPAMPGASGPTAANPGTDLAAAVAAAVAASGTLGARFLAQAVAAGAQPAVSWRDGGWSYAELAQRAGAVAAALAATGTRGPVALLLGHDGPMVAGLLGAVLAGRAYVPLDAYSPRERNATVLADAGATAIVADAARRAAAPWLLETGLPVVALEEVLARCADDGRAAGRRDPAPAPVVPASSPAYILYTSGTTGAPKGVAQTHGGALGQVLTWTGQLGIGADDRLAMLAGYGYDAAVQDLFGALLNGASLSLLDLRGGESAPELVDRLAREAVTVLHATPTVYRHLFGGRVTCAQDLSRVRLVVLGGEEARRSDLELFRLRFSRPARLVNGFGMTECTAGLQFIADHDTRVHGERLPIGLPVAGADLHVRAVPRDRGPDATAAGDAQAADAEGARWQGELTLASAWLASGYPGDASLTAARFIEGDAPGDARPAAAAEGHAPARRLLTGDRVRRLPDGQWLHAGRLDAQLKIRGIRVEPAEVEAALRVVDGVADCAVGAWEPEPGDLRLAAWVVVAPGVDAPALRSALRAKLPEHLVPTRFVALPALPRRANGKLDRAALPAPAPVEAPAAPAVPPRTEIEQRLAALWCGVLGRESIGVHEDFFALGGHSLAATRLIARVRDAFGLEVPLLALFEAPTVAGMAAAVERTAQRPPEPGMPELRPRARQAGAAGR